MRDYDYRIFGGREGHKIVHEGKAKVESNLKNVSRTLWLVILMMRSKGFNVVDFYELYESSLFVQQVDLRHHHLCPAFRAILFHLGAELCTCTEMGVV